MEADQQPVKENWVIFKNCGTVQNRDQFLTKRLKQNKFQQTHPT